MEIKILTALSDNFIFVILDSTSDAVAVLDPSEAAPVEKYLAESGKKLTHILCTHHHWDHVHGNQVYGPEVEIIGHDLTRAAMVAGKSTSSVGYKLWVGGLPDEIRAACMSTCPARKACWSDRLWAARANGLRRSK